ncbi:MAG TPA: 1,4-dihydroxy-2-naphthoate polyprenyltransferase [Epulopiscium sp.]|nr:1,4-dihydroxy-2-naphthoate polyprenyltransferase [Candidatus Epulonipiscium sp.]
MTIRSFLKLVEIQTKVASMIPLLLGTSYALYHFNTFNPINLLLFFLSLLLFDMATTGINNYMDFKKANKTDGYGYEVHNAITNYNLSERSVLAVIFILVGISILLGLLLVFRTNIIILLLGALSFLIGILYSFGPLPISRTPFGELFSGLCMGFIIVFLSIYIHIYDQNMISFSYSNNILAINANIVELFYIFLVSLPSVFCISNIMLANNICDIEEDIENKRYTLPIYIGKPRALKLFKALYLSAYFVIIVLIILRTIPIFSVLALLSFIPVNKNINSFFKVQSKAETFVVAVKNFAMIHIFYISTIILGIVFK